ncbi:hypothetical protein BLI708_10480 [Bifidobacterium imperatoris]|uniref:Uncharacterized protein n=1 Tax=Bifidobacterium imperatoris TaxID=2020965 RepID=A0A2N5IVC4_9BIFI|nr:hypothetical protein [Bifidobacterium imperatoris]PLS25915.1 hypothetical protein Tam1G_0066 [Bifidobacterium imperatoris]QSY57615.1 hypothetical protein BLI708_10480 [Bifidobacterium imperatoris]
MMNIAINVDATMIIKKKELVMTQPIPQSQVTAQINSLDASAAQHMLDSIKQDRSALTARLTPPRWLYPTIALLIAFDVLSLHISSAFDSWTWNQLSSLRNAYDMALGQASSRNISTEEIDAYFQPLINDMLRYSEYSQWCVWLCLVIDLFCIIIAYQLMRWLANAQGAGSQQGIRVPLLWPWFLTFGVKPMNTRMHILQFFMYIALALYAGLLTYINWNSNNPFRSTWWVMVATALWSMVFVVSETAYDRLAAKTLTEL